MRTTSRLPVCRAKVKNQPAPASMSAPAKNVHFHQAIPGPSLPAEGSPGGFVAGSMALAGGAPTGGVGESTVMRAVALGAGVRVVVGVGEIVAVRVGVADPVAVGDAVVLAATVAVLGCGALALLARRLGSTVLQHPARRLAPRVRELGRR